MRLSISRARRRLLVWFTVAAFIVWIGSVRLFYFTYYGRVVSIRFEAGFLGVYGNFSEGDRNDIVYNRQCWPYYSHKSTMGWHDRRWDVLLPHHLWRQDAREWFFRAPLACFGFHLRPTFSWTKFDILGLPLWIPCAIGCLALAVTRRPRVAGRCRECGYSVEGLPSDRCPECGSLADTPRT